MARRPTVTGGRGDGRTVGIIRSVTEPLHVFALFAVVVEVAMGGFAWSVPAADRLPAVLSFAGSIVFLAAVFSLIVFFRPGNLGRPGNEGEIYSVVISSSDEPADFDITQISWDSTKCFVEYPDKRKKPVKPARALVGPSFEIRLEPELLKELSRTEPVYIELTERKGLRWEIRPFYVYQTSVKIFCSSNEKDILDAYGDQQ